MVDDVTGKIFGAGLAYAHFFFLLITFCALFSFVSKCCEDVLYFVLLFPQSFYLGNWSYYLIY